MHSRIITLCGSTRFKDEFDELNASLTLAGHVVFSIGVDLAEQYPDRKFPTEIKAMLDIIHFKKIDLSDSIVVINKDNYIGESTKREIAYAQWKNKEVWFAYIMSSGKRSKYTWDGVF